MITQDEEMLNECLELIKAFKNHLSIINADYLSKHIIGIIRKGVVRYRDPDNNWYYKNFCADIDNVTNAGFFGTLFYAFQKTLQMRNSNAATEEDYILSPVAKDGYQFCSTDEANKGRDAQGNWVSLCHVPGS